MTLYIFSSVTAVFQTLIIPDKQIPVHAAVKIVRKPEKEKRNSTLALFLFIGEGILLWGVAKTI
jgi:hypothetical protein